MSFLRAPGDSDTNHSLKIIGLKEELFAAGEGRLFSAAQNPRAAWQLQRWGSGTLLSAVTLTA